MSPPIDTNPVEEGTGEEEGAGKGPRGGGRGPKNIVLCSDGTANAGGQGLPTNVWALYNAIDINGHLTDPETIPRQVAFHDDGVGTEDWKPLKLIGGAFGLGLSKNIRQLYSFLVKNYNPGDRIYLFGFSRGAFTVRSLAGLIASQGILDVRASGNIDGPAAFRRAIRQTYRKYRAAHRRKPHKRLRDARGLKRLLLSRLDGIVRRFWMAWDGMKDKMARDYVYHHAGTGGKRIACIGVWDTVDAVGVPVDELRDILDFFARNNFHNHDLNPDIGRGYHALSIDDERKTFHPVMWSEDRDDPERVKQVWFAGVHSNVGGGYPKQGLAYVSLYWMMRELERDRKGRDGLHFVPGAIERVAEKANVHDMLYDSRKGLMSLYRYAPRDIGKIAARYGHRLPALVHDSVFGRIRRHTHAYAPGNLPREIRLEITQDPAAAPVQKGMAHAPGAPEPVLAAHFSRYEDFLDRARKWIKKRKWVYRVMLTGLLGSAVLGWDSFDPAIEASVPLIPDWFEVGLRSFYASHPLVLFAFLSVFAVLLVLRTAFRSRAQRLFGEFWWKDDEALPGD